LLDHNGLIDECFAVSEQVRYVAVYHAGVLHSRERTGLSGASAGESDRYEELLVNPTALTLFKQRGDIDCGGLRYILIRYGNFFQFVKQIPDGHISVALEPSAGIDDLVRTLVARIEGVA
jgi:hypothetical protein